MPKILFYLTHIIKRW